jgi:chromosome segregation ATPase
MRTELKQIKKENDKLKRVKTMNNEELNDLSVKDQIKKFMEISRKNNEAEADMLETYKANLKKCEEKLKIIGNKFQFYKNKCLELENENNQMKSGLFLEEKLLNRKFRHSVHKELFKKINMLNGDEEFRKGCRNMSKYIKTREEKISNLEKQIKSQKREIQNLKQENADYSDQMIKLWKDNENLNSLNKSLESEFKVLVEHNDKKKKEFESRINENDKSMKSSHKQITELEDENQKKSNSIKFLKKNLQEIKRILETKEDSLRQVKILNEDYKKKVSTLLGQNISITEENKLFKDNEIMSKKYHEELAKDLSEKIAQIGKYEITISKIKKSREILKNSENTEMVKFDEEDYLLVKHEYNKLDVSQYFTLLF